MEILHPKEEVEVSLQEDWNPVPITWYQISWLQRPVFLYISFLYFQNKDHEQIFLERYP